MRQLFQTTISLCVAEAVVRTRSLFSFFLLFSFSLSLWSPPPSPPSRPASSWTPVPFSCATQSRYMRKCVHACMHTHIHTWEGRGTRQRDLCFSTFHLPFSLTLPSPFCISTRLPFPATWERVWWPAGKQPPPSVLPPSPLAPLPRVLPSFPYIVFIPSCPPPSQVDWGPWAHRRGPGAVELRTRRRRQQQQQSGRTGPDAIFR